MVCICGRFEPGTPWSGFPGTVSELTDRKESIRPVMVGYSIQVIRDGKTGKGMTT